MTNNSYYHEFVPGFNFWYIAAPVMLLLAAWVGVGQYKIQDKRIAKVFDDAAYAVMGVAAGIAFMVMVFAESFRGIVQMLDNKLVPGESPIWSVFLAAGAVMFAATVFADMIYYVGKIAGWARRAYLQDILREERRKERRAQREAERARQEIAEAEAAGYELAYWELWFPTIAFGDEQAADVHDDTLRAITVEQIRDLVD